MIRQLSSEVARKIAAGEVIDRPNAIVRELLDNAVDSGASSIVLELEGGGIDHIKVVDNGGGITEDDLSRCARPHTTSKITSETDLLKLSTLGFRGEALASIASVSRLVISSGGHRLRASMTEDHIMEPAPLVRGTIVETRALFENFPARRLFLKRPASEMIMCRATFVEKALPRPDISFRFTVNGEVKLDLPSGQSYTRRFVQAACVAESEDLFYEVKGSGKDFKFNVIIGEPSVSRKDKKNIYIYVNGRRIVEYSLVQAVEYGCYGYFPNGSHPVAVLFVQIDPSLVDFNIHPAKKEARFQDIAPLHHEVSTAVKNFFHSYTMKAANGFVSFGSKIKSPFENKVLFEKTPTLPHRNHNTPDLRSSFFSPSLSRENRMSYSINHNNDDIVFIADIASMAAEAASAERFRYIGAALGTFLVAEKNDTLYIIDQHAAHERIIYDKIMMSQGKRQHLLIPLVVETSSESDDTYLEGIKEKLDDIGFSSKNCGSGRWEFYSTPDRWVGSEEELSQGLLEKRISPDKLLSSLAALSACKAAIKDGTPLDDKTAADIAESALNLPDPHCPHGRPVFVAIEREKLFALVKRT